MAGAGDNSAVVDPQLRYNIVPASLKLMPLDQLVFVHFKTKPHYATVPYVLAYKPTPIPMAEN